MSRLPIPLRRRKSTTDRAIEAAQSALRLWAASRAAKVVSRRKGSTLLGAGAALTAGVVALKRVRRKGDTPAYSPPPPSPPLQPDRVDRTPPHGDKAADLATPGPEAAPPPGAGTVPPPATSPSTPPLLGGQGGGTEPPVTGGEDIAPVRGDAGGATSPTADPEQSPTPPPSSAPPPSTPSL